LKSKFIKVAGYDLHYRVKGSGKNMVLLHGGLTSSNYWKETIEHFSKIFKVYALDLPGFGLSDKPNIGYSIPEQSKFVDGFLDSLNIEKPILMGHSYGGSIAVQLAANKPEKFKALIAIEPVCKPVRKKRLFSILSAPGIKNILHSLKVLELGCWIKYLFAKGEEKLKCLTYFKDIQKMSKYASFGSLKEITKINLEDELKKIKIPSLFVWGDNKKSVVGLPPKGLKKFTMIENAGHNLIHEKFEAFKNSLTHFLSCQSVIPFLRQDNQVTS